MSKGLCLFVQTMFSIKVYSWTRRLCVPRTLTLHARHGHSSSPHVAIFKFYDIISPSIGHGVQQKGKPNDVIKIQNGDAKILLFPSLVPSLPRRFRMWDVTCQACQENSLGSKPPMLTRIARISLGSRLIISWTRAFSKNSEWHLDWDLTSSCAPLTSVIKYS